MIDVIDQLQQLGEAAELHVEPVEPQEVLIAPAGRGRWRQVGPMRSLGAAAAAVVALIALGIGITRVVDSPDEVVTSSVASDTAAADTDSSAAESQEPPVARAELPTGPAGDHEGWHDLRDCESGGYYSADSGNGFSGAYQFEPRTWAMTMDMLGLDFDGDAYEAPPAIQDAAAAELEFEMGARVWPLCGQYVSGPMTSPVVHGWVDLDAATDATPAESRDYDLIVFLDPEITDEQRLAVEAEIATSASSNVGEVMLEQVDQSAAFDEFLELFEDSPELIDNVDASMLPPSIRLNFAAASANNAHSEDLASVLRGMPGIQQVVLGHAAMPPFAITLGNTTIEVDPTERLSADALLRGVARYSSVVPQGSFGWQPIMVAGHGEQSGDPFYELAPLVAGDTISVTADGQTHTYVIASNVEIAADDTTVPTESKTLTMTTQGSDRTLRRVVTAKRVP